MEPLPSQPVPDQYWAAHLGCPVGQLFTAPATVITHGGELPGYNGVFALFHDGAAMISLPPERADEIRPLLPDLKGGCTPASLAAALQPLAQRVIGPAFIGYASAPAPSVGHARALTPADAEKVHTLQQACDETQWEHGGSPPDQPCSGVFAGDQLVALAGYEVWGETIAHIAVITHPQFRGHGHGGSVVAHLAARAQAAGLLPQYRTLESNAASLRIASSLGFAHYATSLAVRLGPAATP